MKIAVLSGKGGTGKTTVSVGLASTSNNPQYVDCDVEEPNGWIFIKPTINRYIPVNVNVPMVEQEKCTGCGKCAEACQFNAIAVVKNKVLIFNEICHHCGACFYICPAKAIYEAEREIGCLEIDDKGLFLQGKLNVGEPIAVPILQQMKQYLSKDNDVIIDCPPGASCTVVQSIEGCDYCVLVTEPTPFGLHDLKIAIKLVEKMGIPFGVVLNKADSTDKSIQDFCKKSGVDLLAQIPFLKEAAQFYSNGLIPSMHIVELKDIFEKLYGFIRKSVNLNKLIDKGVLS